MARRSRRFRQRQGAMLILLALLLVGFMVTVAFSVDVANMHLARSELRSATDAAAKAAAIDLARNQNVSRAINRGIEIGSRNSVRGKPLQLVAGDFTFGHSEPHDISSPFDFSPGGVPINSVKVNAQKAESARSGGVPLFFGPLFGVKTFETSSSATATFVNRDVVLVLDRSGSMIEPSGSGGTKISELVEAIRIFAATLEETPSEEFVGVASYSSSSTIDLQLTNQIPRVPQTVSRLGVGGATNITSGMQSGLAIFNAGRSPLFNERTMIVMTDGIHNTGPEPFAVAQQIADANITIFTITFGADADQNRMRRVATIGKGKHFHAVTGNRLREVFREIALTLSTLMTE